MPSIWITANPKDIKISPHVQFAKYLPWFVVFGRKHGERSITLLDLQVLQNIKTVSRKQNLQTEQFSRIYYKKLVRWIAKALYVLYIKKKPK